MDPQAKVKENVSEAGKNKINSSFHLRRSDDGTVWFIRDRVETRIHLHHCFPWSDPFRFLSLRDENRNELVLLEDPSVLDADSRAILDALIVDSRFVFVITGIDSANADFELRIWNVQTRQGARRFQTRLDDWPRPLPDGSLLLRDISGDFYHIEAPGELDAKSRGILWAFMD